MDINFTKYFIAGLLLVFGFQCMKPGARPDKAEKIQIGEYASGFPPDTLYYSLFREITYTNSYKRAGFVIDDLIKKRVVNQDHTGLKQAYTLFFLLPDLADYSARASDYAMEASELLFQEGSLISDWNLNYALFLYYKRSKDKQKCMGMASKLQEKSKEMTSPVADALAYKALGEAHDLNGNSKYAIRYLFQALRNISQTTRTDIHQHILAGISSFFESHFMPDHALEYKKKELELCVQQNILDSIQYYHKQLEYQDLICNSREDKIFDAAQTYSIIKFAKQNKCRRLYEYANAFLRTTLMNTDRIHDLHLYFLSLEPEEINQLKEKSPYIFHFLSAFDFESRNQIENARISYAKAINQIENRNLPDRKSYFHYKFGQFLERNGSATEAGEQYEKSIEFAKLANNLDFELKATLAADQFYHKKGDLQKAYNHVCNYHKLLEKQSMTARDQDVYRLEIETEQKIIEEKKLQEKAYKEKFNQVQYNLIAILIFSVLIFLLISVKFKVPIWFIRVMGYVSIIFVFEFCMIQIDHKVHEITEHTPWKIFVIKVLLISFLLPFHHWVEKKLIRFLISRREHGGNLINFNTQVFRNWFNKLDDPNDRHE